MKVQCDTRSGSTILVARGGEAIIADAEADMFGRKYGGDGGYGGRVRNGPGDEEGRG